MSLLAEEIRGILPQSTRAWAQMLLLQALVWIVFGVVIPLRKSLEFFDPMILTAYACLGSVFAIPAVVRQLPERYLDRALARVGVAAFYGEFMALGILGSGIFTVYWTHRGRLYFSPEWGGVAGAVVFGLCLTIAMALAGTWLTMALSDGAAKFVLRIILLAGLVAFLFQGRALPDVIYFAAGVALACSVVLFAILRREIRRRTG